METIGLDAQFNSKKAESNAKSLGSSVAGIGKGVGNVGSGLGKLLTGIAPFLAMGAIFAMIGANFPQFGQSLMKIGSVLFSALIVPIANFLLPLLMKLADWFTSNSQSIAGWGASILSLIKAVIVVVQVLLGFVETFFAHVFEGIFGKSKITMQNLKDLFDLALVKLVFLVTYIQLLLEPVFAWLGDTIASLWKGVIQPFLEGMAEGLDFSSIISETIALFGDLGADIAYLFRQIGDLVGGTSEFGAIMKVVGKIAGMYLKEYIMFPIRNIIGFVRALIAVITAVVAAIAAVAKFAKDAFTVFDEKLTKVIKAWYDFKEAVGSLSWETLKQAFSEFYDWVTAKWSSFVDSIVNMGTAIKDALIGGFTDGWNYLKTSKIGKMAEKLFGGGDEPQPRTEPGGPTNNNGGNSYQDNRSQQFTISGAQSPNATAGAVARTGGTPSYRDDYNNNRAGRQ